MILVGAERNTFNQLSMVYEQALSGVIVGG